MNTQTLTSTYRPLSAIQLPQFRGRQVRYHAFDTAAPHMPDGFADYLAPIMALVNDAKATTGIAYMTVDESLVQPGMSQRRPGPHVDGCFRVDGDRAHWGGGGGGGWLHYCNDVGASAIGRMAVIVAASVPGCLAWKGRFTGRPAPDGDLSHIADQLGAGELLPANQGFLLSPDCVHESVRFDQATVRTFLRIALPVSYAEVTPWDL